MNKWVIAGLVGLFALVTSTTAAVAAVPRVRVEQLAQKMVAYYFPHVDARMLVTMARVESSFNPLAMRAELRAGDASVGLMQTLLGTARWLALKMGATAYGVPTLADLADPEKSMYFGAAYVNYLRNYRGIPRSEEWIVRAYNGGPGFTAAATGNHWQKYLAAKRELYG